MYHEKYSKKKKQDRRLRWNKQFVLLASIVTLILGVVGSSLAYLFTQTEPIVNRFTPSKVTIDVVEEFENNIKSNVKIQNTGDTDAYIRAMIVVTWQDEAGNIYPAAPVDKTDYTITWGNSGWTQIDGYYYHNGSVAPGASTSVLITECKPVAEKTPEGYHLVVDILAEAVQSIPDTAVKEAWGMTYSDGSWSVSSAG